MPKQHLKRGGGILHKLLLKCFLFKKIFAICCGGSVYKRHTSVISLVYAEDTKIHILRSALPVKSFCGHTCTLF